MNAYRDASRGSDGRRGSLRGRRGRWAAAGAAAVVVAGVAAGLAVTDPFRASASPGAARGNSAFPTATATVTRRSLTSQTSVDGTLGDTGSFSVVNQQQGTVTWLPAVGEVIRQGQALYQVAGSPVVLLYGQVPAYRDLSEGMTGTDVAQLNADLVALGYGAGAEAGSGSDYFSAATATALEALQTKLGLAVTGALPLGQAVFLPSAATITGLGSSTVLGGPVAPGSVVLTASSTTPVVTIDLDAAQQTDVQPGAPVTITLPDGENTAGVISQIGSVAYSSSSPSSPGSGTGNSAGNPGAGNSGAGNQATITVLVSLDNPKATGSLNQAPVTVALTTGSVSGALAVPVTALVAQSNGGYAIEVVIGRSDRWIDVTPGIFDDAAGLVQVTGPGLAAGQRVVVPAS
jgi:Putative peptidoglycan binding domain